MNAYDFPLRLTSMETSPCPRAGRNSVAENPRKVLQALWAEVAPELGRIAAAMGVRSDRVDDVLQEVFMSAWKQAPGSLNRQQLKWWLIRVTTNRCNLEHRRRKRWDRVWRQMVCWRFGLGTDARESNDASTREDRQAIQRALEALAPEQRTVLVLRYFENYDSKQIGTLLDMPDSTVRSHLRKGRKMLAQRLKQAGFEYE